MSLLLLAIAPWLTSCDFYVASAGDATEARQACEFLQARLDSLHPRPSVTWRPEKRGTVLHVDGVVPPEARDDALAALEAERLKAGWRAIHVEMVGGDRE